MTQEEINHQMHLIKIHRTSLRILTSQLRIHGASAPPVIIHGIEEARKAIVQVKGYLSNVGISVDDQKVDTTDDWEREFGVE